MNPTREQAIAWAREAGVLLSVYRDSVEHIERFAALAYNAGLERAAEVCDLMEEHYQETEFYKYAEMRTDAEKGASQCAYSIRALKGEKE